MSADQVMPPWSEVPDSWAELAGAEVDDPNEQQAAVFDRWQITNVGEAEWAMQHVAHAQAQIARVDAQKALWQAKLDDWYDGSVREARRTVEFFEGHLARWGQAQRALDPKTATLRLPSGEVATTARKRQVVVTDPDAFCEWALNTVAPSVMQPAAFDTEAIEPFTFAQVGCVRTKHEPRVSIIRDVIQARDLTGCEEPISWVGPEHGDAGPPNPAAVYVNDVGTVVVVPGLGVEDERVTASVKPRPTIEVTP